MDSRAGKIIQECQRKLVMLKQEILNRARHIRSEFAQNDKNAGDEADQTVAHLAEHHFLVNQERLRQQLIEIEFALARIERGQFGICEETLEPIEQDRLLAIPYTRLSIEGAELREATQKRFAR